MSAHERPRGPHKEPEGDRDEPVRIPPDVERAIEDEPVSDRVKRARLAAALVAAWKAKHPGEVPEIEIVDDEKRRAA